MGHPGIMKLFSQGVLLILVALGVTVSIVESSEQSTIIEFNIEQIRRFDEFEKRTIAHDRHDYSGVYRPSKWKPKLQLPKFNYGTPISSDPIENQESQRGLRKIDARELVADMFHGLNQLYFFR
ncbi:uncharacterized protein LOC124199519 isoform X2 [Daphnia pulex]|uniref:uncharacterized protein LOC124199519 isoform X2 n=1 Tax=Daphnia pulex TaxID=6669 RepID=UPI001EE10DF0|nr:uncharacterized protein LOC124199519 isoform X2 [Daphnia pulex]